MTTALLGALALFLAAAAAVLYNKYRRLNYIFSAGLLHVAAWLAVLHLAVADGDAVFWLRVLAILGAFSMVSFALVFRAILFAGERDRAWNRLTWIYLVAGVGLATVAAWDGFLQTDETGRVHGGALFMTYWWVKIFMLILLLSQVIWRLREVQGVKRLEVQIFLLGGAGVLLLGNILMAAKLWWQMPELATGLPLLMMLLVLTTGWTLISHRLMDGRQLLFSLAGRLLILGVVVTVVWAVEQLAQTVLGVGGSFFLAVAVGLWFAAEFWPWLSDSMQQLAYPNRIGRAAQNIAKQELEPEAMEDAYVELLKRWANCGKAYVLMRSHQRLVGGGLDVAVDFPGMAWLQRWGWVTPERLERERERPGFASLREFMREHQIGVLVTSSSSLAMVLGLPAGKSLKPYTYPQIRELLSFVSVMESALSRAHYLMKTQHSDRLATVGLLGASIAHEIRNPLVTIKTFVQLLPQHYHEVVFRDKFFKLIGDEVGRIDRMTEQLLDLAAPRVLSVRAIEIDLLLSECCDLIRTKADDKGVTLTTHFTARPNFIFADSNAVKQVVLNLGFNAIQAQELQAGERWIKLSTVNKDDVIELQVEDNGPGLKPEVWERLFQPFHSTKSSGFGLGLAICKDILAGMNATIRADQPKEGCGAKFRIELPCPPRSS